MQVEDRDFALQAMSLSIAAKMIAMLNGEDAEEITMAIAAMASERINAMSDKEIGKIVQSYVSLGKTMVAEDN